MDVAPINLMLQLWSLGHSYGQISRMLGVKRWKIIATVQQARTIGDKRAVLHYGKNGQPIGNPISMALAAFPEIEVVPAIPAPKCRRGHLRSPENVTKQSVCRECDRIRKRAERARA